MQIKTAHQLELPVTLRKKLENYRRRVWLVKLAEGILAGIFGLILSYLLVFVLDRFWDTTAAVRLLLLLVGVTGCVIWLPVKWHRWVWRTRRLEQAARLLRHRFPRVGDQLLGIVELAHNALEQERSESLCRAAMRQVEQEVRTYDFRGAVPHPRHRHWAWAAAIVFSLATTGLFLVPAAATNALARWLFPWRHTERYTFAQLQQLPSQIYVPYAEPFLIRARLAEQSVWLPERGRAQYGDQLPVPAPREQAGYRFSLPPQKEPADLTISVGDARQKIRIDPTSRPELIQIIARVELPEYLQYPTELVQDVRSGTLSLVRGSRFQLSATATRVLDQAFLGSEQVPTSGTQFDIPAQLVTESRNLELHWRDGIGLQCKSPFHLQLRAVEDEMPTLTCSKLQREQVVQSTDVLTFEVAAHDDFGVKTIGVEWQGIKDPLRNPHPTTGEQAVAAGSPESRDLTAHVTYSAQQLKIPPQSLEVRVFVVDYLPDRPRVYSPTYVIHVLTPEEHAIWLTQQLRKWLQQANEVYEQEQRLFQANQSLRALSPEELDQPDTRRRIAEQASAEQNNARKLTAVTDSGEKLIEKAMQNDQFNVATLEDWAEMLKSLKDIAQRRMPSVADLLTDAAGREAAATKLIHHSSRQNRRRKWARIEIHDPHLPNRPRRANRPTFPPWAMWNRGSMNWTNRLRNRITARASLP